jgi:hypothetical protein
MFSTFDTGICHANADDEVRSGSTWSYLGYLRALGVGYRSDQTYPQGIRATKNLANVLESHDDELVTIRNLTKVIRDEEALRTAAVISQLVRVEHHAKKLNNCLQSLDPGCRGLGRQITHQLVRGSAVERLLADIMDEISRAKSDLSLHIQVANVGLTKVVGDRFVANMKEVRRIEDILQQSFGRRWDLRIALLLKDRPTHGMLQRSFSWYNH